MHETLERIVREEWGRIIATLIRVFGDFDLAEDVLQEACIAALDRWPRDGVPENPGAWLTTTARRRAIDRLRRDRTLAEKQALLRGLSELATEFSSPSEQVGRTDRLRLIFTCCHPSLAIEAQVALTLRTLGGLTTAEIARAFLLPEATLAQRLVRAKRKIRQSGIRFAVPGAGRLPERLAGVRAVVYLVFNEGHTATGGGALVRADLCEEAIWLGRLLCRLLPGDPENEGLLALMLLHHSRAATRQGPDGRPVLLADQDRQRWDQALITEGLALLDAAVARRAPGPYQLQAAVAAVHAQAPSFADTDWPQIAALYGELARRAPSPVVEINRAVAVGMADGPLAGLTVLAPVLASGSLAGYAPLHAAHADLLERLGQPEAAAAAWARAAAATGNDAVHAEMRRRGEAAGAGTVPENS